MSRETKKVTDEWNSKITDCDAYTYTYNLEETLKSIDNKLMDIENNLNNSDFGGIGYESQYSTIEDIIDKMITINDFVDELPNHMEAIDSDYCRDVQNGSVYELSKIKLEDFETRKVGSLSSSYRDHGNAYSTETISLNFADFLGISGNENDYEEDYAYADGTINDYFVRSFADIFQRQYNEEVDAGSTDTLYSYLNGEMTAGEFVQKRQHSIFLKAFSDVVDIIPIAGQAKMLYEMASGKEAFTGDELTFSEMRNATIFTAVSVLAMPEGLSGISSKFFDGAVVDIEKGIGIETLDELNRVVVDDCDGSPIIGRLEGGEYSAFGDMSEADGMRYEAWNLKRQNGLDALDEFRIIQQGNKDNPNLYLSQNYIDTHLAEFKDGASIIVTQDSYDNYMAGKSIIGYGDNSQFVMPKSVCEKMLDIADGNTAIFEDMLGFKNGYFKDGGGLIKIDIDNLKDLNLRMPSGNEAGANELWLPGGYTSGGVSESIVNCIPSDRLNLSHIPIQ